MGEDIKDILGFHFNPSFYEGIAKRALNNDIVSHNIERVTEVSDALVSSIGISSKSNVGQIISTLFEGFQKKVFPQSITISKRDARALAYNILSSWTLDFHKFCLEIVENNWSNTMLRGLMHCLMSQWDEYDPDAKTTLLNLFTKHIDSDNSRFATQIRPLKDYLIEPYKIGRKLLAEKKTITDCCSMFGIPSNRFSYSFFTTAIIAFFEQPGNVGIEELKNVLRKHNNIKSDKTLIPRFIIHVNNIIRSSSFPKEWTNFAIERIGDPSMESKWAPFPMATREVQINLEKARTIVLAAISSEFVRVFFYKLCHDPARLNFWLKHTGKIRDFKVYGTATSKSDILQYVNGVVLSQHFYIVSTNTTNCALVMYMGDYVLIEFTETGALYAYRVNSKEYNNVFGSGQVNKLDDLKLPYMHNLIDIDGYYNYSRNEGRMIHTGYWQSRLNDWISRKI